MELDVVLKWVSRRHLARNRWGRIEAEALLAYLDSRGERGQHIRARRRLRM